MNAQPTPQPGADVAATDTNSTTIAYQKFAKLLMTTSEGASSIKDAEDIWTILHKIIIDCSRAHVEAGKTWITHHCRQERQFEGLTDLMIALVKNTKTFDDKLHIIYLVNDLLAHGSRKQERWMIDVLYPKLVPLLRLAYHCPNRNQQGRQKVLKVIGIWKERQYFDPPIITLIQNAVMIPMNTSSRPEPSPDANESGLAHRNQSQISTPLPTEQPKRSYFELPVGPMIDLAKLDDTPYKAIHTKDISVPSRPLPTEELKQAMTVYYDGLTFDDDTKFDAEGWEHGFLDGYLGDVQTAKAKAEELQAHRKRVEESRLSQRARDKRSASPDDSYRVGTERTRGRSPRRSGSRSRSRSRGRRRSSSRTRYRRKRSSSLRRSRSRSQSMSPPPGRRQPSRSRTPPRSHLRSPPPQSGRGLGYSNVPEQRFRPSNQPQPFQQFQQQAGDWDAPRAGLGAGGVNNGGSGSGSANYFQAAQTNSALQSSGDVFDNYRRNRSYTFNRDSGRRSEPAVCFKCNQPGHLARDCSALAAPY